MDGQEITIDIVPTEEQHIAGYRECVDAVARERSYLMFIEAPPLEESREFVFLLRSRGWPHYVALAEGEVIGWIDLFVQSFPGFEHSARLGMGVRSDFRGLGIGTQLMRMALRAAARAGFRRIELDVYADNTPAVHLYERHGFVVEGRKVKARVLDGKEQDILLMALFLPENAGGPKATSTPS